MTTCSSSIACECTGACTNLLADLVVVNSSLSHPRTVARRPGGLRSSGYVYTTQDICNSAGTARRPRGLDLAGAHHAPSSHTLARGAARPVSGAPPARVRERGLRAGGCLAGLIFCRAPPAAAFKYRTPYAGTLHFIPNAAYCSRPRAEAVNISRGSRRRARDARVPVRTLRCRGVLCGVRHGVDSWSVGPVAVVCFNSVAN